MARWSRGNGLVFILSLTALVTQEGGQCHAEEIRPGPREQGKIERSGISIATLRTKLGRIGAEATLELRNESSASVHYASSGATQVDYSRQCFRNKEWQEDDMGRCGVGEQTQFPTLPVPAGSKAQLEATLCRDGSPTRIGISVAMKANEWGEKVWSEAILAPELDTSDPMPEFRIEDYEVTVKANQHLKKRGALGALGRSWKLAAPEVAGVTVSDSQARKCVRPGRYAIAHYPYIDKPADGPNSIVFEVPLYSELQWVGDVEAMTMAEAIDKLRNGSLCE